MDQEPVDSVRHALRAPDVLPRVRSDVLLGSGKELVIVHNQREYRLRITQNGKLILTA
ncbi:MAG: hemin uptake protein HemP [Betaproteobacteria bacterium]|nr:MAG: hemin uptake protein HemP [Betaproteobacteria bacterium]